MLRSSQLSKCRCGVSQESVLAPILFTVYTSPIAIVADAHHVNQQLQVDDRQLYVAFSKLKSAASIQILDNLETILVALQPWFVTNGFTFNLYKTGVIQM